MFLPLAAMRCATEVCTAVSVIRSGGVIAYPTEAVYGFGCDPANEEALARLASLKKRSVNKGFIIVAARFAQLRPYCKRVGIAAQTRAFASWPGPFTWVFPASSFCSPLLTGGRATVATRVSAHPVVAALCRASETALVSTSANLSGHTALRSARAVVDMFGGRRERPDLIVSGRVGRERRPTPIRDAISGFTLRD